MKSFMNAKKETHQRYRGSLPFVGIYMGSIFFLLVILITQANAGSRKCGSFYLRNNEGAIINPLTGENADQPFSTRKTCGTCHDYDEITKGYHFQQGWENISDTFSETKPWILSDGMMGKH